MATFKKVTPQISTSLTDFCQFTPRLRSKFSPCFLPSIPWHFLWCLSQLLNPFLCTRLSATVLAERIFLVFHHASAQTCPSLLRGGWWVLKPPHYCFASLDFRCAMVSLASESGMPKHFVICSTSRSGGLVRHFFQKAESHCGCGDL